MRKMRNHPRGVCLAYEAVISCAGRAVDRMILRMSGGNNHGGARNGAGRPVGSGDGRSVTTRSVSMTPEMWAMIDRMRGHSSRGVFLSACLHRQWNASQNSGCPPPV